MVRPHPLTFFARQHLMLKEGFIAKHPEPWLVWQATADQKSTAGAEDTWVPGQSEPAKAGDPLCFELTGLQRFRIGSVAGNEVIIYEPSVGAEHCVLTKDAGGWQVTAGETMPSIVVSGNPVAQGIAVPLSSGDVLEVGEVRVTFLSPEAFAQRAAAAAAKM
jgi:hypothetical protein